MPHLRNRDRRNYCFFVLHVLAMSPPKTLIHSVVCADDIAGGLFVCFPELLLALYSTLYSALFNAFTSCVRSSAAKVAVFRSSGALAVATAGRARKIYQDGPRDEVRGSAF